VWTGINAVSNLLFGPVLGLSQLVPSWLAGALLGALAAPIALVVFRYTSVRRCPARAVVPMILLMGPFTLALAQLEARFALRPLEVGEQTILRVQLTDEPRPSSLRTEIRVPRGLALETPALRKDAAHQIAWRLRANQPGRYLVKVWIGEQLYERRLLVGARRFALARGAYASSDVRTLLAPTERVLPAGGPVECIEIDYPRRTAALGLSDAAWSFIAGSLVLGFVLRRPLGIEL
jgi:hypothetical protein